jgi:hypothetical protein
VLTGFHERGCRISGERRGEGGDRLQFALLLSLLQGFCADQSCQAIFQSVCAGDCETKDLGYGEGTPKARILLPA